MTFRPIEIPERPAHALAEQAAPMLQWVPLADLVLDGRYQREITGQGRRNIQRIAADFRWSRFSPLLVAPVEGGKFAVIDGQHRAHAAALCGIEAVPVVAVLMDLREQAQAFAAVNGAVTKVSAVQFYKAALAAGEGWAVECDRVVRAGGCELMTTIPSWSRDRPPRRLICVALVRGYVAEGTGEVVTAVLRGITASSVADDPDMYNARLLKPFCAAVAQSTRYLRADLGVFVDRNDLLALQDEAGARSRAAPHLGAPRVLLTDMLSARLHAFTRAEVA